jgi:hypothetical protein
MTAAKYRIGQFVVLTSGKRQDIAAQIKEVIEEDGDFFYRIDRKNCLHEAMIRALTPAEVGDPAQTPPCQKCDQDGI